MRRALELGDLGGVVRTALEIERVERRRGELLQVRRVGRAEVALRGDMHPDRLCDLRAEMAGEERVGDLFVARVDPVLRGIGRKVVDEVAVVVQERGGDEARRRTVLLGGVRGLQHVLGHRHLLAEVLLAPVLAEDREDLVDQLAHLESTASRLRRPSRSA